MPEWMIVMVVIWVALAVSRGGRCGRRRLGPNASGRSVSSGPRRKGDVDHPRRATLRPSPAAPPSPAPPRETAEERLRREFVEGRLSMEEYEEALWRELRPK